MSINNRILIIDDEISICRFLRESLKNSFEIQVAESGAEGLRLAIEYRPHLVILDLHLGDMNGQDVIKKIRDWSHVPIIILSAKNNDEEKVTALDAGANDYLTKPFSMLELSARIRASLRVSRVDLKENIFILDPLWIDFDGHTVKVEGKEIHLTSTEFDLLRILALNKGRVVTHQSMLQQVWGPHSVQHRQYLRVYMGQMRKKLNMYSKFDLIKTEPNVGYKLISPEE
jgi:two-component system KDP operon response regulator KdpE